MFPINKAKQVVKQHVIQTVAHTPDVFGRAFTKHLRPYKVGHCLKILLTNNLFTNLIKSTIFVMII